MTHQELRDYVLSAVGPGAFKDGAELGWAPDGRPTIDVIGTGRKYFPHVTAEDIVMVEYGEGNRTKWAYLNRDGSFTGASSRMGSRKPELN